MMNNLITCQVLKYPIILLLFLTPVKLRAQTSMQYGDNIHSAISGLGEIHIYRFTATANDIITVFVGATPLQNGFLARVEVHKPDGSLLKRVDGNTVRIDTTLTANGDYTIWVMDN